MAEAKAEAQESSSPMCLLLLAGGLQAACQAVQRNDFACWRLQAAFLRNTSLVYYLHCGFGAAVLN